MNRSSRLVRRGICLAMLFAACASPIREEPPLPPLEAADPEVVELVATLRAAISRSPDSVDAWARLGDRYRAQLWFAEAAVCYARCETLEPGVFRWPYLVGKSLRLQDAEAAEAAFARALTIDADYAPARLFHGRALAQLGRDAAAREAFEAARRIDPGMAAAYLELGHLALRSGQPTEARGLLLRALELEPGDGRVRLALARVARAQGEVEAAERHTRAARLSMRRAVTVSDPRAVLTVEPVGAFALGRRGRTLLGLGRPSEALPLLQRSVEVAPDRDGPRVALGLCLAMLGRLDAAEEQLRAAVRIHPGNPEGLAALGKLLVRGEGKRLAEGVERLEAAIELEPLDRRSRIDLARGLRRQGRPGRADALLREWILEHPEDLGVERELASGLLQQGKRDEANRRLQSLIERYRAALDLQPGRDSLRVELARTLLLVGDRSAALVELRGVEPGSPAAREAAAALRAMGEPGS